jgi:hypothetical protein
MTTTRFFWEAGVVATARKFLAEQGELAGGSMRTLNELLNRCAGLDISTAVNDSEPIIFHRHSLG